VYRDVQGNGAINQDSVCYRFENANESRNVAESTSLLKGTTRSTAETKNKLHKLEDILMIVLCSLLSGINDWVGMEDFANDREDWFRSFFRTAEWHPLS